MSRKLTRHQRASNSGVSGTIARILLEIKTPLAQRARIIHMAKLPRDDGAQEISQVSHASNSPNIVGSHNTVMSVTVNQERRLSDGQKGLLIQFLSPFSGRDGSHLIDSMFQNTESIRFAM